MIEIGLDEIICSVDSCNEETYKKLQGNNFEKVVHNIMVLKHLKKLHLSKIPNIRIQTCKNILNRKELENGEYEEFWGDLVDEIKINKELNLFDQTEDFTILKDFCCDDLFERLVVLVDGKVLPCCAAYDYVNDIAYSVGNIHEETIEEIYTSEKLNKLRDLHKKGKSHEIEMCRKCRIRKEMIK
jgi:molybdenum cofactor biosynthesis enzyme MoaA